MERNLRVIAIIGIFIALFAIAGKMDFEDESRSHLLYCDNVASGIWPNYDKVCNPDCTRKTIEEIEESLR